MRRSDREFAAVKGLQEQGLSTYEIARRTGIPRATVQHWRSLRQRQRRWQPPDGARCINRFDVALPSGRTGHYEYPRYFFSNLSVDIRRIFCDHCELLGVRWTQSNPRNISVSHRHSVAILDRFVGPKR